MLAHTKTKLMLQADFKSLMQLPRSTPAEDLQAWCTSDDGRRGLERFAFKEYGMRRKDEVAATRDSVLREQRRQRDQLDFDEEAIAQASRFTTRRARTFAHFLAVADGVAATTEEERPAKRCKVETDLQHVRSASADELESALAA